MAMGAASILLMMVSLETLLLAAGAGAGGTIRLSSDVGGVAADLVTAMARARARAKHQLRDEERPWGECCDLAVCVKTYPLTCSCFDRVERCSDACKECVETEDSRHVCVDRYRGDPGPRCHDEDGRSGGDDDKKKRPWKCCDVPICTRSWPPVCRCADTVERCASTCQHCEQVEEGGPRRYRCLDTHRGDPGPRCGDGEDDGGEWSPTPRLARGHRF
ncbi:Bowman-Birk type trypsin inhibitor [Zea mays]|uniref:Bowman-Birk type trypsin inhibitor n=1 Tax=Zea mays TaxID=4577 RepID=A0A1D6MM93_MAIZE|nr:Bowman-Birk type trypsin inhibitor [Zea mays]